MQTSKKDVSSAWDQYWKGDRSGHAYTDQGESQPAIQEFWTRQLSATLKSEQRISMIDLACGNGSVSQLADSLKNATMLEQTCLDVSPAALENIVARLPQVTAVQSNMSPIELPSQSYDLVVSQFGIEYAGEQAFGEAMQLVKPNGKAIFVIHVSGGVIEQESRANHDAIARVIDSQFIDKSIELFKCGYQSIKTGAVEDKQSFKGAAANFNTALKVVEDVLKSYGVEITAGTIHKLYNDIANIVENMPKYDETEVLNWLENMRGELATYRTRMSSMLEAAMSEDQFKNLESQFSNDGFKIDVAATLVDTKTDHTMAWAFVATRLQ